VRGNVSKRKEEQVGDVGEIDWKKKGKVQMDKQFLVPYANAKVA